MSGEEMVEIGTPVLIDTPENPRIHNKPAIVKGIHYTDPGPAAGKIREATTIYILECPAAGSGEYRALRHEFHTCTPLATAGFAGPAKDPEKPLQELSGVARKAPLPTGDLCPNCWGFLVQTGTCKTCQGGCGFNTGGCS